MMTAAIIGGLIGFIFARMAGLLVGAAIGFGLAYGARHFVVKRGLAAIQAQFLNSTFAVMGAMCKADGQVTAEEVQVAEQLFDRLSMSGEQREAAKAAFNRGKAPDFDLDSEVATLARVTRGNRSLLQLFLQVQLSAIGADGVLHAHERDMLLRVARGLGLPDAEVQRLEAMLRGGAGQTETAEKTLEDAYNILGVTSSASDAEVKKAYRRLMSQHHPDKLASQGMPESMREIAEQRTREIRSAYDTITRARERA